MKKKTREHKKDAEPSEKLNYLKDKKANDTKDQISKDKGWIIKPRCRIV